MDGRVVGHPFPKGKLCSARSQVRIIAANTEIRNHILRGSLFDAPQADRTPEGQNDVPCPDAS